MTIFQAFVLGIVEGITEFLPVSSTGHLLLMGKVLKITSTEAVKSFDIVIQLGAIGAAITYYWQTLKKNWHVTRLVLIAFIPTAILGAMLHSVVKKYLLNAAIVPYALLIGGIILILFERWRKEEQSSISSIEAIPMWKAFLIGVIQTLSIIPGTSRSAATIVGGMMLGVSRTAIVDFSFLLAIPTMLGAATVDLMKSAEILTSQDLLIMSVGFVTSFFAAYVAIGWLLQFVQRHSFVWFGIYRIAIALLFWAFV